MIHKYMGYKNTIYNKLFAFYTADFFDKYHFLFRIIQILTVIIVNILPYWFTRFVWYRILVYMTKNYIPINLMKLDMTLTLDIPEWSELCDLWDYYEINELNQ